MSAKNTIIYLCRHGLVENPNNIWYGRLPGFHLGDVGRAQAQKLGEWIHKTAPELAAIYSSPLERTKETALGIATYFPDLNVRYDDRLLEVGSPTQGRTHAEMDRENWNFFRLKFIRRGGEKLRHVFERIDRAIKNFAKNHQGQTIAVVSHADPIMCMRTKYGFAERLSLQSIRREYIDYIKVGTCIKIEVDNQKNLHIDPAYFPA